MKKLMLAILALALAAPAAVSAAPAAKAKTKAKAARTFKPYSMDKDYFSCSIPSDWSVERDADKDAEYRIYEVQLLSPKAGKAPVFIYVSYYAKDNEDFNGYEDFVRRNSRNVAGETRTNREVYETPRKTELAGRRALELVRERLVYLHPESKSDESVQLKEKMYVLPAKEGFYVLHFSAPKAAFVADLPVFEKVAASFKGKF